MSADGQLPLGGSGGSGGTTEPYDASAGGALVRLRHMESDVNVHGIIESDLDHIAVANTLSNVMFALGSSLISFALGIKVNATYAENMSPAGELLDSPISWILIIVAVAFYSVSGMAFFHRRSAVQRIKRESRPRGTSVNVP